VSSKQGLIAEPSFSGRYGAYSNETALCRDPKLEIPGDVVPACKGGGAVYSVTMPRITEPPYGLQAVEWVHSSYTDCAVPSDCMPSDQTFHRSELSSELHATYKAWYDFDTGTGGAGSGLSDDQQGEMPENMPETGVGGLAPGAAIPVGNAAAGLMLVFGAGYVVLRRQ
jgi:hypothetical protein